MKLLYRAASAANRILLAFAAVIAAVLFAYGLYVLCDIFYINRTAFVSYDLLQYRPVIDATGEDETLAGFQDLLEINPDTVGWIELFGTNINYPVVHGDDDLEYLNKDIYGNSALSGSIYLAADNSSGFNDWYNLIYGHHMDNGAMFGDIDKYLDQDYFDAHRHGVLQTLSGAYDISVFACVSTDSYEGLIYRADPDSAASFPMLMDYIRTHAEAVSDTMPDEDDKLLGLSTCTDAVTNGRIVLFATVTSMTPEEAAAAAAEAERVRAEKDAQHTTAGSKLLEAVGHLSESSHWALLNLICVLLTAGILLPLPGALRKYRQLSYAKRRAKEQETAAGEDPRIRKDLRRFVRLLRIGTVIELLWLVLSVIVFLRTENMAKPITFIDGWTGPMILIAAVSLLTDFICFRYRGIRPDTEH